MTKKTGTRSDWVSLFESENVRIDHSLSADTVSVEHLNDLGQGTVVNSVPAADFVAAVKRLSGKFADSFASQRVADGANAFLEISHRADLGNVSLSRFSAPEDSEPQLVGTSYVPAKRFFAAVLEAPSLNA